MLPAAGSAIGRPGTGASSSTGLKNKKQRNSLTHPQTDVDDPKSTLLSAASAGGPLDTLGTTCTLARKSCGLVGLGPLDDLVKCVDGIAQLVGAIGRLRIGLDNDHQILVGNPDIDRPIAETFALIEPLRPQRP